MKKISYILLLNLTSLVMVSCKLTSESKSNKTEKQQNKNNENSWPKIENQLIKGQLFGQDWQMKTAALRSLSGRNDIVIDFYSDAFNEEQVCGFGLNNNKPFATVNLPNPIELKEYVSDLSKLNNDNQTLYPVVFVDYSKNNLKLNSDKTKIVVNKIEDSSIELQVFAKSNDTTYGVSEVNGYAHVIDCRNIATYSDWSQLFGQYNVKSFDEKKVFNQFISIQKDDSNFFSRELNKKISAIDFSLVKNVNNNFLETFNFGPMLGLGRSLKVTKNNVTTWSYKYLGAVNIDNKDIVINLDLKAVQNGNILDIDYILEVANIFNKTQHKYQLEKINF